MCTRISNKDKRQVVTLHTYLRGKKKNRKKYSGSLKANKIRDRVSIDQHPKNVDSRKCYADWQGDGHRKPRVTITTHFEYLEALCLMTFSKTHSKNTWLSFSF